MTKIIKGTTKAVALFAFWCAGMLLWYKFLLEAVR